MPNNINYDDVCEKLLEPQSPIKLVDGEPIEVFLVTNETPTRVVLLVKADGAVACWL
jgi:hypothetical protein